MYNIIYNTSYLLNIQDYWTRCNHIFTSGIISARKPTPHQPPRAHPNFPHPTASQIATPFRNCHRGEWSRTLVLQFKSKGATYLKSENGVMRRASCLRHFSFFFRWTWQCIGVRPPFKHAHGVWNGLWLPCPSQTPFFFVVEPQKPQNYANQMRVIILFVDETERNYTLLH